VTPAYARFLTSADVDVWTTCLDEVTRAIPAGPDDDRRADLLAEALCIAFYLAWLARVGGRIETADRTNAHFAGLRRQVLAAGELDTPSWRRCWALVLVNDGFPARAADVIGASCLESPEIATLLVRGDDVTRLKRLRGLVRGTPPTTFLPTVFDYVQALINAGGVQEAQQVLATGGWNPEDPLLIELHGSIHERLGQWPAALTTYRRSPWPAHRYRAAVIETIIGQGPGTAAVAIDAPLREVLAQLDGDLDQAEMARSIAFLNACLWRPVENWMVQLELGKMGFRRRQFAEADVHLLRALASAPDEARSPIASTRFSNLTWLTGDEPHMSLNLLPEAFSAGEEAIRLGGDPTATANVRIWLARESQDLSWIPESLADWPAHERAEAYDVVGDTPRAIDVLIENLDKDFYHRSASRLMRHLHAAGLTRSALWLADVVFRESGSGFLALWETCLDLQRFQLDTAEDTDDFGPAEDGLPQVLDRYRERLVELSQFEFMNAIRTHVIARQTGYEEQAEELLLRAAKQAEGVSELIAVAVLRRTGPARGAHSDQEALRCLTRAHASARDRRERLEIARELCHFGAVAAGRAILHAERALSADTALTHSEMAVALQCAPWCTENERADLALRAGRRLTLDTEAGRLGRYPWAYGERLDDALSDHAPSMLKRVQDILDPRLTATAPTVSWSGESAMAWPAVQDALDPLLDADEGTDVSGQLDALCDGMSFGLRLMTVIHLRGIVVGLQKDVREVTPQLPAHRIPINRWYDVVEGPRVMELRELWRSRMLGDERAAVDLRTFHATEQDLTQAWEQRRSADGAPILRRIVAATDALCRVLGNLLDASGPAVPHPVLRELFGHMAQEVATLTTDAVEQAAAARRMLDDAGARS
jgi:tetratricopeptide (TPR) repeat protein